MALIRIVTNSDDRIQRFRDMSNGISFRRLLFKQNDHISHSLNFQLSNTTNVPRYDRLQDTRDFGGSIGRTLRYAEWYYGPQKRILGAYEFNATKLGFADALKANINFQDIDESRLTTEYRQAIPVNTQAEKVNAISFNIDATKKLGKGELFYGIEYVHNQSKIYQQPKPNLTTGAVNKVATRYPDGQHKMSNFGVCIAATPVQFYT